MESLPWKRRASAHERARLEVYNVGGLTYTAYSSIQSLWSPIVAPTTGPFDRVLRYSNTSCALDTLEVVLPANDTTGGCGNATCAGSVVLLMGVPHDEWGVDLEGVVLVRVVLARGVAHVAEVGRRAVSVLLLLLRLRRVVVLVARRVALPKKARS